MQKQRRKFLKSFSGGTAAAVLIQNQSTWTKPVVESVVLPAHAGTTQMVNASALEGDWRGTWTNTTFSSNGGILLSILDNGNGTLDITVDLGGFVGGLMDPPAHTITANINPDGSGAFSGAVAGTMIGPVNINLANNGALSISLPNIMLPGFASFSASGVMTASSMSLNYTVNFTMGSASGTANATKI